MRNLVLFLALIAGIMLLNALLRTGKETGGATPEILPWQINIRADGNSEVFGLVLTRSTLDDARLRFGRDVDLAVIAAPGEAGSLEAYYQNVSLGMLTGKMILLADLAPETLARLRQRAVKTEFMDSRTRKYSLHRDDLASAWQAPIAGITFIPAVSLDEQTILKRFGEPDERIRTHEHIEHFLYPRQGLDLIFDSRGREVLQYVAPRQFARVRAPLLHMAPANAGKNECLIGNRAEQERPRPSHATRTVADRQQPDLKQPAC